MLHSPSQVDTYQSRSQKSDAAWPFHVSIDAMNETKLPDNNELELMLPTIDDPILHGAIAHDGCESSHSHSNDVGDEFHEAPRWNSRMSRLWTLFMLLMLYACQGSIVGLIGGTLPILLKPHLAYAEVGLFGLAFYPYSMKLLWSPIIDFYWFERLGRRKSWIVPTQLVAGCFMIALGLQTPQLFQRVKDHDLHALGKYVLACFCLIFLFASQGCAMDGWGLTLLPISSAHWVSTVKIVGMTLGSFVSYTLYILVNSSKFLQTTAPLKKVSEGESLGTLTTYLGLFNLVCGALILFFKSEEKDVSNTKSGLLRAYKIIFEILRIGCVRQIILVQLLAGLGFEANDAGTNLKLLDKGFGPKNIAIMTAISLPFDLASSVVAGTLCFRSTPMVVWNWSFNVRLAAAILAQLIVALYPLHGIPLWYSLLVYLAHVISVTSATTMAIALSTLHLQICDPSAGGTYMTLLHTAQNLGTMIPRILILKTIDWTGRSKCVQPQPDLGFTQAEAMPMTCNVRDDIDLCIRGGGKCNILIDGYQITNLFCVITGGLIFWTYLRRKVLTLQMLPREAWSIGKGQYKMCPSNAMATDGEIHGETRDRF